MVHRVAALERDSCNSKKCDLECIRFCPVNKDGSECIILGGDAKAVISEDLCTGCGICIKKCPFEAITILNLAEELLETKIHQYGINTFRLYRLPVLRNGSVVGLVGRNGVGKTTALNILSGNLKPNLGNYEQPPEWDEVLTYFKGTEFKDHFSKIASKQMRVSVKPQTVYLLPKMWKGTAGSLLKHYDERGVSEHLAEELELDECLGKEVSELSGGELQRLAIGVAASREADLYLFDEPSSYNDVYQRLRVAKVIQGLAAEGRAVLLVEHDLTLLDYLSDFVHILYGEPGAYGIVTTIHTARTGINILLDGYLPSENVRFRDNPVRFNVYAPLEEELAQDKLVEYTRLTKTYPGFKLTVEPATLRKGEVVGVLGANALGKTTFMKMIAGVERQESGAVTVSASVAYKPQYLSSEYEGTVEDLLAQMQGIAEGEEFKKYIFEPLRIKRLFPRKVSDLSGGELQKVANAVCLGQEAEIYALDEPSAFLDIEDRIVLAKAIQGYVRALSKSALVIDHDIQLVDVVSDTLIIFDGTPGKVGYTTQAMRKEEGMNMFLRGLDIAYRRDVETGRPRVNKPGSKLDRQQKAAGRYYYLSREPEAISG